MSGNEQALIAESLPSYVNSLNLASFIDWLTQWYKLSASCVSRGISSSEDLRILTAKVTSRVHIYNLSLPHSNSLQ